MSKKLPRVRVDFYISGDDFDIDVITNEIGIKPTKTRKKSECPVVATALTYWRLSTEDNECKVISWQMEKLIKLLDGKEAIITNICNRLNLEASFTIVVEMENGDGPELVLDKHILKFLSCIDAEIGFDLYID